MTRLDQAFIKIYADRGPKLPDLAEGVGPGFGESTLAGSTAEPPVEVCGVSDEPSPESPDERGDYRVDRGTSSSVDSWLAEGQAAPPPHVPLSRTERRSSDDLAIEAWRQRDEDLEPGAGESDFQAMLQVDRLAWPSACRRLAEVAADELQRLADALVEAMAGGVKVVGVGGCRRGEGATTLLLCAGRRLAELGLSVVLVDAHLADPQFASRLNLLPEAGWEDVLAGQTSLDEVVIESIGDRVAVLPVCRAFEGTGLPGDDECRLVESIETLANHYDLVLIDPGPLEELGAVGGSLARGLGSRLDAIALVHHGALTPVEDLDEVRRSLMATEIVQLGVIENFVRQ